MSKDHSMGDAPGPAFGFVGWNPFQMLRFLELARATEGSVLVLEKRAGLNEAFWDRFIAEADVPVLVWDSNRMASLEGLFDVIVCQTPFAHIGRFEHSKIAMLQYGLAKEPHNHGAWRALADLCLVYGPYTASKMSYFCPVAQVGDPHMDRWGTPGLRDAARQHYAARLDATRKTVLYVPTWGDLSTQDEFSQRVIGLSDHYNVLIKLHHNTDLLESHRAARGERPRVHYFGANTDLLELLSLSDVVLSDYSGAIFDALYCEKPVVLLQTRSALRFGKKLDAQSLEYAQRNRIGPVVESPGELLAVVTQLLSGALSFDWPSANRALVNELYIKGPGAVARASAALLALARDEIPARSQQQSYVREEIRPHYLGKTGSTPKSRKERVVLDDWLRRGEHARVLKYAELRGRVLPKLYVYRAGLRAAHSLGEHERYAKLMAAARKHFPIAQLEPASAPEGSLDRDPKPVWEGASQRPATKVRKVLSWRSKAKQVVRLAAEYAPPQWALTQIGVAYALGRKNHREQAVAVLDALPDSAPPERALLLASWHRQAGDDVAALRELSLAQREHPGDARLLTGMADAFAAQGQNVRAHLFLQLSALHRPVPGKARLLYFQSEMGWLRAASHTLDSILAMPIASLSALLANVNRATVHHPQAREQLAQARLRVREYVRARGRLAPLSGTSARPARRPLRGHLAQAQALKTSVDNRWVPEIAELLQATRHSPLQHVQNKPRRRAEQVLAGLGPLTDLIEVAWLNEHEERLTALSDHGRVRHSLTMQALSRTRTVELFVPTPFFAYEPNEKVTYETVRSALRQITSALLARDDLMIVPRLQLNWRHVAPRTSGHVVSYHTHGPRNPRHWHVQEAPLSGFVSIDSQGFAGFASIAEDFSAIDAACTDVTNATLAVQHRALYERYVCNNVSKYPQAVAQAAIPGRYVFVPLQIMTDIAAQIADLDALTLMRTVADAYAGSDVRVVVKRHPYCHNTRVQRAVSELADAGRIIVSAGSVHGLLAGAEAVYTVNSGVGLEALLHLKPVVVTGGCDYQYAATRVHSVEALADVARARGGPALDRARALRFLYFYATRYLLDPRDAAGVTARISQWLPPEDQQLPA